MSIITRSVAEISCERGTVTLQTLISVAELGSLLEGFLVFELRIVGRSGERNVDRLGVKTCGTKFAEVH